MSVFLSASNPNPQVGELLVETVTLTCDVFGSNAATATVSFSGPTDRLEIDEFSGTASLILDASDAGATFTYTCSATTTDGLTATSNEVIIIPSL